MREQLGQQKNKKKIQYENWDKLRGGFVTLIRRKNEFSALISVFNLKINYTCDSWVFGWGKHFIILSVNLNNNLVIQFHVNQSAYL